METNNKYINMNQFPHNKNGTISWKESVGVIANFLFYSCNHKMEILSYTDSSHIEIKIDDNFVKIVQPYEIINLSFEKLFHQSIYHYNVGDIIDNIQIIEKNKTKRGKSNKYLQKSYRCCCLKDGYTFIVAECDLNRGHRCPLCANKVVVNGVNDIATTNPDMTQYFKNKEDAYQYTFQSNKIIDVKCPICGFEKRMSICSLYRNGFSCDMCSDGISYSNKFAHELFSQLSGQCLKYEYEYSPDWAKKYLYDNYIKLLDGKEIVVEMDGAYHYIDKWHNNHDREKDVLAELHNIEVIRVDCNYKKTTERFEYIKNNTICSLKDYFDLSIVNWDKCNLRATSSILIDVVKYYNENKYIATVDIAKHFGICMDTLRNYLHIGETLGLCKYDQYDTNRIFTSKPIAIYDMDSNLIGIYKSAKQVENSFTDLKLYKSSVFRAAQNGTSYKNYLFKFVTHEEYLSFISVKN